MNEAETIEALSNIADSATGFLSIFISITFAYLTVAYLAGAALSRLQLTIINSLYVLCAILTGGSTLIWWEAWVKLHSRTTSVLNEVWLTKNIAWLDGGYLMLSSMMIASIYFMHDVRKHSDQIYTGNRSR